MTRFVSLSSGSNGNCYYIGNESFGILIDAGIGTRTIKKRLAERGLSVDSVRCVLVSHDHFDHIRSLGTFAERFQRPIYATAPCIAAFRRHYCTKGYLDGGRCRPLLPGEWLRLDGESGEGVWVLPFSVPHDATGTVGFHIRFFGETFTFLTDVGDVTEDAVRYAAMAQHLIVEANYDPEMLRKGPYPPDLQARIRNGHGHLSNGQTADLIRRALAGDLLQDIFLCHLSENNNTPELALAAVSAVLPQPLPASDAPGIRLVALPRREASELFTW
jgi:phosphoribosyl 1,2-cyclic phosphodiesterase